MSTPRAQTPLLPITMTQSTPAITLARQPISPRARLTLWWALLAAYSMQDVILTTMALYGIPSAREMNPIADLAFERGFLGAFALKTAGLAIVLGICWKLSRTTHWPLAERTLACWCIVLLTVNAYSAIQILGGP